MGAKSFEQFMRMEQLMTWKLEEVAVDFRIKKTTTIGEKGEKNNLCMEKIFLICVLREM